MDHNKLIYLPLNKLLQIQFITLFFYTNIYILIMRIIQSRKCSTACWFIGYIMIIITVIFHHYIHIFLSSRKL